MLANDRKQEASEAELELRDQVEAEWDTRLLEQVGLQREPVLTRFSSVRT